jgi:hypothetical protein
VRPNTAMIEASWGGAQYPNHTESGNSNYIDNYTLHCGAHGCLFNVKHDYTEQHEVSAKFPEVVASMMKKMTELAATIWSTDHKNDPACHPFGYSHYGGFYGPWKELDQWEAVETKYFLTTD